MPCWAAACMQQHVNQSDSFTQGAFICVQFSVEITNTKGSANKSVINMTAFPITVILNVMLSIKREASKLFFKF